MTETLLVTFPDGTGMTFRTSAADVVAEVNGYVLGVFSADTPEHATDLLAKIEGGCTSTYERVVEEWMWCPGVTVSEGVRSAAEAARQTGNPVEFDLSNYPLESAPAIVGGLETLSDIEVREKPTLDEPHVVLEAKDEHE